MCINPKIMIIPKLQKLESMPEEQASQVKEELKKAKVCVTMYRDTK